MRRFLFFILSFFIPIVHFSQGFTINANADLIDANGNVFIPKGYNVPLAWFQNDVAQNIANMKANTGVNSLRIVVGNGYTPIDGTGNNWNTPDATWQSVVQTCIDNEIIPVVEVHNILGSNEVADLRAVAQWWASKAAFLTRDDIAPYILLNICNEWGDWMLANPNQNPPQTRWRDGYIEAVEIIRNAGIKTTIIIDAPNYGQDFGASTIINHALDVLDADPERNLQFSVHMYCEWSNNGGSNPSVLLPAIKNAGISINVGEFAYQHATDGSCDIDVEAILNTCEANGIGWYAWSWKGNGGDLGYMDLSVDWAGTNLNGAWGERIVNGTYGTKTGMTCSVFESEPNNPPTVSITLPSDNSTFIAQDDIVISATASDTDGTVSSVKFYNGNILLYTDNTAPYTFTWVNVAEGNYTITAVATDDKNSTTTSTPISIVVSPNPCPFPNLGEDMQICPATSITLSANITTENVTYSWSKNGEEMFGNMSSIDINTPGVYSVTASKTGCITQTDEIIVENGGLDVESIELCTPGIADLSVSGGTGVGYDWFADAIGGVAIASGSNFSPSVDSDVTYYIQDIGLGESYSLGLQNQTAGAEIWNLTGSDLSDDDKNIALIVMEQLTINAVSVYSGSAINNITIRIMDGIVEVYSKTFSGVETGKQRLELDFELSPGNYTMDAAGTTGTLAYQSEGAVFPYVITDVLSFTGTQSWVVSEGRYGLFYDWEISTGMESLCGRTPVSVNINPNSAICNVDCAGIIGGGAYFDACGNCVAGNTGLIPCITETIILNEGWNLISFSINIETDSITEIFGDDIGKLLEIKTDNAFWLHSNPVHLNSLNTISVGKGYLVKMAESVSVELVGTEIASYVMDLETGWNLIGTPSQVEMEIDVVLNSILPYLEIIKDFDGMYESNNPMNSISNFEPYKGYFIKVSQNCDISWE
jgi:hypothetical protein